MNDENKNIDPEKVKNIKAKFHNKAPIDNKSVATSISSKLLERAGGFGIPETLPHKGKDPVSKETVETELPLSRFYTYKNEEGEILGHRVFYEKDKFSAQRNFFKRSKSGKWLQGKEVAFSKDELFGLETINKDIVIIVNSEAEAIALGKKEKTKDKGIIALGENKALENINLSSIAEKNVVLLFDNSNSGVRKTKLTIEALKENGHLGSISVFDYTDTGIKPETLNSSERLNDVFFETLPALKEEEFSAACKQAAFEEKGISTETSTKKQGFVCLGYDGSNQVIWSESRQCIVEFPPSKLQGDKKTISEFKAISGVAWLADNFGEEGEIDAEKLVNFVYQSCDQKGLFVQGEAAKGAGVWKHKKDLIINLDKVTDQNNKEIERFSDGVLYKHETKYPHPLDIEDITDEQLETLLEAISSWNWVNPAHAKILIGYIAQLPICGGLKWRSHAFVTGRAGAGKSTLAKLLKAFFDGLSINLDAAGASPAGIRQKIGLSSRGVILDEFEGDNPKSEHILELIRSASAGDEIAKGTSDQKGMSFQINSSFISLGINRPSFEKRDSSRHLILEIDKIKRVDGVARKHDLLMAGSEDEAAALGKAIFSRMVRKWDILSKNIITMANTIAPHYDDRLGDTLGVPIACYYTLMHGEEISESKAIELMNEFSCFIPERDEDVDDEVKCIDFLATQTVMAHIPYVGMGMHPESTQAQPMVMSRLIKLAAKQQGELPKDGNAWKLMDTKERMEATTYIHALEHYGLKAFPASDGSGRIELFIPNNPWSTLTEIYNKKESSWQGGIFKTALTRLEGYRKGVRERFKASSTKPTGFRVITPLFLSSEDCEEYEKELKLRLEDAIDDSMEANPVEPKDDYESELDNIPF